MSHEGSDFRYGLRDFEEADTVLEAQPGPGEFAPQEIQGVWQSAMKEVKLLNSSVKILRRTLPMSARIPKFT